MAGGIPYIYLDALFDWLVANTDKVQAGSKISKIKLNAIAVKLKIEDLKKLNSCFEQLTSVHPVQVCEYLEITKTERLRWQKEGKLKIAYMDRNSFKYGSVPMFCRNAIALVTPKTIERWRKQHIASKQKRRKDAAEEAKITRRKNDAIRKTSANACKNLFDSWSFLRDDSALTLQLAYWTVFVSRWAKFYQEKAWENENQLYKDLNYDKSQDWYEIKNEAIALLSKSPIALLYKHVPESPHRYRERKQLSKFALQIQENGGDPWSELDYYDRWDFVNVKDNNYYCLYFLTVTHPDVAEIFTFHTPYPIGKKFLPLFDEQKSAPDHSDEIFQQGMHRYGRSVNDLEQITHSEKLVKNELQKVIKRILNR